MNDLTTMEQFKGALRAGDPEQLDSATLSQIRKVGVGRRATRRAASGLAAIAGAGALAAALAVVPGLGGHDERNGGEEVPPMDRPDGLTPLQERVLREIPGARRVSAWEVVLPQPEQSPLRQSPIGGKFTIEGATVPMDVPTYARVTAYPPGTFPGWLHDEVESSEAAEIADKGMTLVDPRTSSIRVESGTAELACLSFEGKACAPGIVRRGGGTFFLEQAAFGEYLVGPGDELKAISLGVQLPGDAPDLGLAALPGRDVARVEFVSSSGEVTEGQVTHEVYDGVSIMWADAPGLIQRVIAYDADGEVVGDARLPGCSARVDC